jgi:hypothetical protein
LTRSILLWRPAAEVWYGHSATFTPHPLRVGRAEVAVSRCRANPSLRDGERSARISLIVQPQGDLSKASLTTPKGFPVT